jgi:hypothetical protein
VTVLHRCAHRAEEAAMLCQLSRERRTFRKTEKLKTSVANNLVSADLHPCMGKSGGKTGRVNSEGNGQFVYSCLAAKARRYATAVGRGGVSARATDWPSAWHDLPVGVFQCSLGRKVGSLSTTSWVAGQYMAAGCHSCTLTLPISPPPLPASGPSSTIS